MMCIAELMEVAPNVLGFSGRIGSGKSAISKELARLLGWQRVGFGDVLRLVARQRDIPESRESLQELGAKSIEEDCQGFCARLLEYADWSQGKPLIIDGIRHLCVLEALKNAVAPSAFHLIYLDVDSKILADRYRHASRGSSQVLEQVEMHSTEREVLVALRDAADLKVDNTISVAHSIKLIMDWMQELGIKRIQGTT
jgi:cytidylate kinase